MKFVAAVSYLLGYLVYVTSERFEVKSFLGNTCIMLETGASFNLSYTEGNATEMAPSFDLKGATVIKGSSKCGIDTIIITPAVLAIRIVPSGEILTFTFKLKNKAIEMSTTLNVEPEKHFNMTAPSVALTEDKALHIGPNSDRSYRCLSAEIITFKEEKSFSLSMELLSIQVQAYHMRRSQFGPAIECNQDMTTKEATTAMHVTTHPPNETTTEPHPETTTEPHPETITTPHPETITTPHPETKTTPHPETTVPHSHKTPEPHTGTTVTSHSIHTVTLPDTTIAPSSQTTPEPHTKSTMRPTQGPKPPKFVVKDNKQVCIVLEGRMKFDIPYVKKDKTKVTAHVEVPANANVKGNCQYNTTHTAQEITLTFFNPAWVLDVIISKGKSLISPKAVLANYAWQSLSLSYVVDGHFAGAINPGAKISAEAGDAAGKFKANTDGSYKCMVEQDIGFGKDTNMKLDLTEMQYRAFGVTNSTDFPNSDISECPGDDTDNGGNSHTVAIALGLTFAALAVILIACGVWYRRKKQKELMYDALN